MSYKQEQEDIEEFFTAAWGNETPIVYDNGTSENVVEWVRLSIQHGEAFQASMGDNPEFRYPGIVFVQIFTAKDDGSGRAMELADKANGIFQNAVLPGNVRFKVPQVRKVPTDSEWFQVNVSTEFYRGP